MLGAGDVEMQKTPSFSSRSIQCDGERQAGHTHTGHVTCSRRRSASQQEERFIVLI